MHVSEEDAMNRTGSRPAGTVSRAANSASPICTGDGHIGGEREVPIERGDRRQMSGQRTMLGNGLRSGARRRTHEMQHS